MEAPTEHVFQTGSYYTRKIECTWLLDKGPSYAEYGSAPLQLCPKARENIEELLATHRPFGIKVVFHWKLSHPTDSDEDHKNGMSFYVSPATLSNGNMGAYNFDTLLTAIRREFLHLVENNEKLAASNLSHDTLQKVEVYLHPGTELNMEVKGKILVGGRWVVLPEHLANKKPS